MSHTKFLSLAQVGTLEEEHLGKEVPLLYRGVQVGVSKVVIHNGNYAFESVIDGEHEDVFKHIFGDENVNMETFVGFSGTSSTEEELVTVEYIPSPLYPNDFSMGCKIEGRHQQLDIPKRTRFETLEIDT